MALDPLAIITGVTTMKKFIRWMKARFSEPSTFAGIAAATGVSVPAVDDPQAQSILIVAALINALISMIKKDKGGAE